MCILKRLKRKRASARSGSAPPFPRRESGPRNGPLIMALALSIVSATFLSVFCVKLMGDPLVVNKAAGPPSSSTAWAPRPATGYRAPQDSDVAETAPPPNVTFYSKLTVPDDRPPVEPDLDPTDEAGHYGASEVPGANPASEVKHEIPSQPVCPTPSRSGAGADSPPQPEFDSLGSRKGKREYTVQVGAFSEPQLAKQWAEKWRARGYTVHLKPVARPKTGIIYRLYLGSFATEKKADDLVKRLKEREGITAFIVSLRE